MKAGFVSFIGRPNAGKSTLLNRIVGQKLAFDLLRTFLDARFSTAEEFRRRVAKLAELDRRGRTTAADPGRPGDAALP